MVACATAGTRRAGLDSGRGFTLIEMVVSMTILAIILSGTYSVVLLASRMAPSRGSPQTCTLSGARTLEQLSADLAYAISVTDLRANSITFTVPDRTGDATAETLRYSWSGAAGDPLMYSINGSADTPIADDVREFGITAITITPTPPSAYSWGSEQLLASNNSLVNLGSGIVTKTNWYGQTFLPVLASDARNWKVTRVRFQASQSGAATSTASVEIRTVSGGLPTSTILDQATLTESTLPVLLAAWQQFTFANVPPMSRTTPACFVIEGLDASNVCSVVYQNLLYTGINSTMVTTVNSGTSWTGLSGSGMVFEVYGKIETQQTALSPAVVDQVRCALRLGPSSSSRVETLVRTLNQPYSP